MGELALPSPGLNLPGFVCWENWSDAGLGPVTPHDRPPPRGPQHRRTDLRPRPPRLPGPASPLQACAGPSGRGDAGSRESAPCAAPAPAGAAPVSPRAPGSSRRAWAWLGACPPPRHRPRPREP